MVPYKHKRSGGKSAENAAVCHLCPWMEAGFPPIVAFKSSCVIIPLFGVRVAIEIKHLHEICFSFQLIIKKIS